MTSHHEQLTFSVEVSHAKVTVSPEIVAVWLKTVVRSGGSSIASSVKENPPGSWERTYRVSFHPLEDETLRRSSDPSFNSGMAWSGGFLTLNISEFPKGGVVYSLSGILEDNPDPKYSLSQKACAGILNRAEKRGKVLPELLQSVLQIRAQTVTE